MPNPFRKLRLSQTILPAAVMLVLFASGFLFYTQLLGTIRYSTTPDTFSPIDLVDQTWFARQGFVEADSGGFDPTSADVKPINKFPIQLNDLFNVPSGDDIHDFTLMVRVNLNDQAVKGNLMLKLAQIGENWNVYLNGTEIWNEMSLDSNGHILQDHTISNILIAIPQNVVHVGSNTFVFHIKGHAPPNWLFKGWRLGLSMSKGYLLSSSETLIKSRGIEDAISWLQMGVYFCFGMLQLFMFFRQKEFYTFYFGLFLFSCAIYSFSYSNQAFNIIPDTSLIYRTMFAANFLWPGLVGLTLWNFFYPGRQLDGRLTIVIILTLAFTMAVWIIPFQWAESTMSIFLFVVVGCAIYLMMMIIQAVREKISEARKIFISACFVFVVIIWTVVDMFIFRTGIDLLGWTPFFLAIAFAIIFIERLWMTTVELTLSNKQLTQMRDSMEDQVITRTHELRGVNIELETKLAEIYSLQESLRTQALRDGLTGLYNRHYLDETMDREFKRIQRNHITSLMMIDIDHFKRLNDTFGHKAGDLVLKAMGACLTTHFRQNDLIFRFGGEEFLIVLPEVRINEALLRAEDLRQAIEQMLVVYDGVDIRITISLGLSEMHFNDENPDAALKRADAALYRAKERGRNRVEATYEPT